MYFFLDYADFKASFLIDFIATNFPVNLCMHKLTLPKAPFPKTLPII